VPGPSVPPILDDVLAYVDCSVEEEVSAGTHTIFIGHVLEAGERPGVPLGYYDAGVSELRDRAVIVETFPVGMLACNCTILGDAASGEAIVIDGGDDVDAIAQRLAQHGLRPRYLVHTHAHFDHIGALGPLRERCGGAGLLHHADRPLYADIARQYRMIGLPGAFDTRYARRRPSATADELSAGPLRLRADPYARANAPVSTSFALDHDGGTTCHG